MTCLQGSRTLAIALLAYGLRRAKALTFRLAYLAAPPVLKRALAVSGLAALASVGYLSVTPPTADAIPALCDGTVQTECLLGDSGWTVTIPPNVTIKFMGLDRPSNSREDIWFVKTYDVFNFSPVTLTFTPFQPDRISNSFFRMDEVVTNKTISPFNAFQFTTADPQHDACSELHPAVAHIHPNGTNAPNPNFGGPTEWDGLLPVQGRCSGMGQGNFGTDNLVVAGRTVDQNGGTWEPKKIRLHEEIEKDTWTLTEQVAPEPSTFALAASGLLPLALGYLRRRERAKRLNPRG